MAHSADYDSDILEWSEEQASTLRRLGRRRADLTNELDWEHVAEEIEDVGRSEFLAVQSLLRQILVHLIKALSTTETEPLLHWRKEVVGFHRDLLDRLTPSMRARLDLARLWQQAIRQAEADLAAYGQQVRPAPRQDCPLALDDLLDPEFEFLAAIEKAGGATSST